MDVIKLKPDPEGIMIALRKLEEQNFFFVGDLFLDYEATKRAGGISIMVKRNLDRELNFSPDYAVKSLLEVPNICRLHTKIKGGQDGN